MLYNAPFYAVTKALYYTVSNSNINLELFDSATPIYEIEDYFKNQEVFSYAVMCSSSCDANNEKDSIVWNMSLDIEIYSNYKGRKIISEKLENLLNYLSSDEGWQIMQNKLIDDKFQLLKIVANNINIGLPIFSDNGIWQNGKITFNFTVEQIE